MRSTEFSELLEAQASVRKRLFEAGEIKLLVLHFISQQPKFSYDIIKDISNLVGGNYKPSTGTICPTIQSLEQQQYIQFQLNADQRKQYSIAPEGQRYLDLKLEKVNQILRRFDTRKQIQNNLAYVDIKRAMENLKAALRLKIQHSELDASQIEEIADKIDAAAVAIGRL